MAVKDKYFSKEFSMKSLDLDKDNKVRKKFEGSSPPAVFIGSKLQYPSVNVGVLSSAHFDENSWLYNSPDYWSREGFGISKIIELRSKLINSRFKTKVSEARNEMKLVKNIQELGMAALQADVEVRLENKPLGSLKFDRDNMPLGKFANMKNLKIITNPKIPQPVEKVYWDKDLKSLDALKYLYSRGFNEHSLMQVLSIGVTGLGKNRKFVPTRNSITAVDDSIGKHLLERVREFPMINDFLAYFGGHLGNYYLIIMLPEVFHYELFEMSLDEEGRITGISTDYEGFGGRKDYAGSTEGGYYAARLPIIQKLMNIKKQAAVLALRFVLPSYNIPLGVWVCRNSARKSLEGTPKVLPSIEEALNSIKLFIRENFNADISRILNSSVLLKEIRTQAKLSRYF